MIRIQVQDAKAKFSEMLERVSNGETIIITKHGKATAVLQGMDSYHAGVQQSAWDGLREETNLLENDLVDQLFARPKGASTARIDPKDLL
jgi:prevent-host-death family protein